MVNDYVVSSKDSKHYQEKPDFERCCSIRNYRPRRQLLDGCKAVCSKENRSYDAIKNLFRPVLMHTIIPSILRLKNLQNATLTDSDFVLASSKERCCTVKVVFTDQKEMVLDFLEIKVGDYTVNLALLSGENSTTLPLNVKEAGDPVELKIKVVDTYVKKADAAKCDAA